MPIVLHIYSQIKDDYFYINQKVKDTRDNREGIIYKLQTNGFSTEQIVNVSFAGMRKAYISDQHQYLVIIS